MSVMESRVEAMLRKIGNGQYQGVCSVYSDPDDVLYLVREFCLEGTSTPSFVQVVMRHHSGQVFVREMHLTTTNHWVDSDGCVSLMIENLLPSELFKAELVTSFLIENYLIGDTDE